MKEQKNLFPRKMYTYSYVNTASIEGFSNGWRKIELLWGPKSFM